MQLRDLSPGWRGLHWLIVNAFVTDSIFGRDRRHFRGLSPSHRPRSPRSVPRSGRAAQEVRQERRLRLLRGNRLLAWEPISQGQSPNCPYGVGTTVGTIEGAPHATGSRLNDAKE